MNVAHKLSFPIRLMNTVARSITVKVIRNKLSKVIIELTGYDYVPSWNAVSAFQQYFVVVPSVTHFSDSRKPHFLRFTC